MLLVLGLAAGTDTHADGRLIGSWVKHDTQQEDHAYPDDTNWHLEVSFQADGAFVWQSTRTDGETAVDEAVRGTFSASGGVVTVVFDPPSTAAAKRLPEWVAYWPSTREGRQTFRFQDEFLVLGHDGNKLWFRLKRKDVDDPAGSDD